MRYVRAFALGAVAAAVLLVALVLALSVAASAAGPLEVDLGLGPFRIAGIVRARGTTETALGPGALAVAVLAGLANAGVLAVVRRRAASRPPPEVPAGSGLPEPRGDV